MTNPPTHAGALAATIRLREAAIYKGDEIGLERCQEVERYLKSVAPSRPVKTVLESSAYLWLERRYGAEIANRLVSDLMTAAFLTRLAPSVWALVDRLRELESKLEEGSAAGAHYSSQVRTAIAQLTNILIDVSPEAPADGPEFSDGHDHEGFEGGCRRFGHTPETCPELDARREQAKENPSGSIQGFDGALYGGDWPTLPEKPFIPPHADELTSIAAARVPAPTKRAGITMSDNGKSLVATLMSIMPNGVIHVDWLVDQPVSEVLAELRAMKNVDTIREELASSEAMISDEIVKLIASTQSGKDPERDAYAAELAMQYGAVYLDDDATMLVFNEQAFANLMSVIGFRAPGERPSAGHSFQGQVDPWVLKCFGWEIAQDKTERCHRFFEEATELVQSLGMTRDDALMLIDYTYNRPLGEPVQEVGGVMVTLAALCLATNMDMHTAGWLELSRIWGKVDQIRAKQAAKPRNSPLPGAVPGRGEEVDLPDDYEVN